jgi:hypothetical protein
MIHNVCSCLYAPVREESFGTDAVHEIFANGGMHTICGEKGPRHSCSHRLASSDSMKPTDEKDWPIAINKLWCKQVLCILSFCAQHESTMSEQMFRLSTQTEVLKYCNCFEESFRITTREH